MRHSFLILLLCVIHTALTAQAPERFTSSEIYDAVQKLNFLGSAMYVAAHPDDENTRLISYLSNQAKARTCYLSLTRGDGGQNLIGTEIRELLGVLRTQELMSARAIDGGEQLFSRANDFGYSKHPDETLTFWDRDEVIEDMVRAVRNFRPDVIINRFDHRTPGSTHGHHTLSAMLSTDVFDLAADATSIASLTDLPAWQARRLFFNTSWWFYGSRENFAKADKSNMVSVDIGTYYPTKGWSNNEIAAHSRSQHLCQGFGRMLARGTQLEYLELLKGDLPDENDLFHGINTTWSRIEGGKAIGAILTDVEQNFDFRDPSTHLPDLLRAYQLITQLEDAHWRSIKSDELEAIITACAGLYLEVTSSENYATPGDSMQITIEAVNRCALPMKIRQAKMTNYGDIELSADLPTNEVIESRHDLRIKPTAQYTSPYWLVKPPTLGMYQVDESELIGLPETPRHLVAELTLDIDGMPITLERPVVYRYAEPDQGEQYQPFEVMPAVTVAIEDKVTLFTDQEGQEITVIVGVGRDGTDGKVSLDAPNGWQVSPLERAFHVKKKGDETRLTFRLTPPPGNSAGDIRPVATADGAAYHHELVTIDYPHIAHQRVLLPSKARVAKVDLRAHEGVVGYIMGAGDVVPDYLRQAGYTVELIEPDDISQIDLSVYSAIMLGIRAYNVVDALRYRQEDLLDYVSQGGTMIVQYNTNRRVDVMPAYPLTLSRDRVTDEMATVHLLEPDHPALSWPNRITEADFEGWVQERGLYFPSEWSDKYTPLLSMADQGEEATKGSLLVAKHGEGHYVYTGLSFFRELPAGVPGAYRLLANLLALGSSTDKMGR